jgi:histidinol-phosphate aminotransferase
LSAQPETKLTGLTVDVRRCVAEMVEYAGPEDAEQLAERLGLPLEQIVKLDGNENPYGPTPKLGPALAGFGFYQYYYDPNQTELRRWISQYVGLPPEHIMAGNGADEMIDLLLRAFLDPGDELMDFPPSFGMYSYNTQHYDARVVVVERDGRFEIEPERALAALTPRTKIIMLTSPNNPTGNRLPTATVEALLQSGRLVVVDEAYAEFSSGTVMPLVPRYENLVVLRTFSKWAALAGLRLGYALLPIGVARHLWKLKPPFNINQAAVIAARESIQDRAYLLENCARIVAERERLLAELPKLGYLKPYSSEANFILCDVLGRDALELKLALREQGILLRHYRTPRLRNCIRISVGTPPQSEALLSALRAW